MLNESATLFRRVHCRTGSLESFIKRLADRNLVHCRTGSLESIAEMLDVAEPVHCRTGSLETMARPTWQTH